MAKEKKKGSKKKKKDAGPRDAVRGAVESTFARAAGGANQAQKLLDDVAATLKGLREANLVETLESVRDEVQNLAKRVAALELRQPEKPATPARRPAVRRASTTSTARKPAARKPAARKTTTAASKPAASRSTTARKATTTAGKPATARKTTTARKPAARKPAAAKKPTSSS